MPLDTRSFLADVNRWAESVHERAVEEHAAELDRVVPEATGAMRRDQQIRHLGGLRSEITYPAEYASYTDEGTDPHPIHGNPLLAFEWEGQLVIVHSVNHPGTRGTRWWSDLMTDEQWANSLEVAARVVRF